MSDCSVTRALYDDLAEEEDKRLSLHALERALTFDTIAMYLPRHSCDQTECTSPSARESPSSHSSRVISLWKIADIGGATGTYASTLADRGDEVHLRDLSPGLLAIASSKQAIRLGTSADNNTQTSRPLASIGLGNALDPRSLFPLADAETFDAVLLLGPLYHLLQEEERRLALRNGLDLLKPSGVLFAAFISRNAHLRDMAVKDPNRLVRENEFYERYLLKGQYVKRGKRNAESYHSTLSEIRPLVKSAGGQLLEIVGMEGVLGGGLDSSFAGLNDDDAVLQAWVRLMRALGRKPENLGNADHWLVVIRKNGN